MLNLSISIPNFCSNEFEYTVNCIFKTFLGLHYTCTINNENKDTVVKFNENSLVIKNSFFKSGTGPIRYSTEDLPKPVHANLKVGSVSKNYVSLYGIDKIEGTKNNITIHSDFIAGTFFMLSRWEEFISEQKDDHHRASCSSSATAQYIRRPIVNEYVEIIWACLLELGFKGNRKNRNFEIIPTHDVDHPYKYYTIRNKISGFFKSILTFKTDDWKSSFSAIVNDTDPFDTYDLLLENAEKIGAKAEFNFMNASKSKFDDGYNIELPKIQNLIYKIKRAGHIFGFHPSYNTSNNIQLFNAEIDGLRSKVGFPVIQGRQHYLRFQVPQTWRIWSNAKLEIDSSMGYADKAGFRCGVCYDFPVYDLVDRKPLSLLERPLIAMEVTLMQYEKLNPQDAIKVVQELKNEVKKYQGNFVFLWHNSSFNSPKWNDYFPVFEEMYSLN